MTTKYRKIETGAAKVVLRKGKRARYSYSFGDAVLTNDKGQQATTPETLEMSRKAMRELGWRLRKPGVKLRMAKGVPKFYVDEGNPDLIVREVDGKQERGTFEDGKFKAVA
ncbi:hypothetical protein ACO2Q3_00710 [Caulobacter sp. KR2-114]|uniref:hypothetical protein n=1 Tax=Caulobacter sp. KR2-114 TaxID=3400912 RepID=UPI003C07967E